MAHDTETGKNRGFTLLELMIVLTIIAILVGISIPIYKTLIVRTREVTLKVQLHHLRDIIDQYTADKKKAPQTLQDLVDAKYYRELPWDPITDSTMTWQPSYDGTFSVLDQSDTGITDVHSGSNRIASDGTPYNTW